MKRFLMTAGVGYVLIMAAAVAGLRSARQAVVESLGTTEGQRAWDDWREAVQAVEGERQVVRSIPRSAEPPALVLLRDHFSACLLGVLVMTTPLYWSLVLFIRGVLAGQSMPGDGPPAQANGRGSGQQLAP